MKDEIVYQFIRLLVFFMGLFPRAVLRFMSDAVATIWFDLDKRHRDVVCDNIQKAYPGKFSDSQALKFAKRNFKHTASILFDAIWAYGTKKETLLTYFEVEGKEFFDQAFSKGKGVVLLACHLGNFELLSVGAGKAGIYSHVLYRKLDFIPLERMVLEMRQRFGSIMLPLRKASGKVIDILNAGGVVATLLDQNVDWYKGVFVDFFNRPACTNSGLAKLMSKTNAMVVPIFLAAEKKKYIIKFLPGIDLSYTNDSIKDVENNTQVLVSAVESMVRQYPEQYFWVHNRWKTKPFCRLESISERRAN